MPKPKAAKPDTFRNRIVGHGEEAPDQLLANPLNARVHGKAQQAAMKGALDEIGFVQQIVVNKTTGHVLDGHMRVALAMRHGAATVPVTYVELTEAEERLVLLTFDQVGAMASIDKDNLRALLEGMQTKDDGLLDMLADLAAKQRLEIQGLTRALGKTDPDEVPEPPKVPITKPGDLWIMGKHRLLCGDSTKLKDVERVIDGAPVDLVVTDPPWNVAYGKNMPSANAQGYKPRQILNDDFATREGWESFLGGLVAGIQAAAKPGAPLYCFMGPSEWPSVDAALRAGGFHWSSTIIWAKDQLVLSRKDYHTQYEPMWYGWKEDAARLCEVADRKQSDVWQCVRPKRSDLHPTTKPVELLERAINNSSRAGGIVFDPFGGSGSTLIACEIARRQCRCIELDPKYVDVIVQRWEQYTNQTAERISRG